MSLNLLTQKLTSLAIVAKEFPTPIPTRENSLKARETDTERDRWSNLILSTDTAAKVSEVTLATQATQPTDTISILMSAPAVTDFTASTATPLFHQSIDLFGTQMRTQIWLSITRKELESAEIRSVKRKGRCGKAADSATTIKKRKKYQTDNLQSSHYSLCY